MFVCRRMNRLCLSQRKLATDCLLWRLLAGTLMAGVCGAVALAQTAQSPSAKWHLQQGITFLNQHDIQKALDEFRFALRLNPKDAAARDYLGETLVESGETQLAVEEFQKAIQLSDSFAGAHFHLGLVYDRLGQALQAVSQYEKTLYLQPGLIDARYALSAACWKLGDAEGAIELLRQIARQDPPFAAEVHYNLGTELSHQGKLDEAVQELKTAINLEPTSPNFYGALIQALTQKQDLDAAAGAAKRAVELAPDQPKNHYNLAETLRL